MVHSTIDKSAPRAAPGAGNKLLLLDRDGVINIDHIHVGTVDRFHFTPGLFPTLRAARDRGYRLAIVTNQSGVARGLFTRADYDSVTDHMRRVLLAEGIALDLVLACFHHPDGQGEAARESFWRKPNPGMVLQALHRLYGDPARSVLIGDQPRDIQAAQAGGIATCLWLTDRPDAPPAGVTKIATIDDALAHLP